jgi:L,D-transpeptidase-like protein
MWQRFVRWFSPETRFTRAWHIGVTAVGLLVLLVMLGEGTYGLFTAINRATALNAKARLDQALGAATTRLNAPAGLLQPIRAQEQQVAATTSRDGSLASWQQATQRYTQLAAQVHAITTMTPADARAMTQRDLSQLQTAVAMLAQTAASDKAGVTGYQNRYQQAQQSFQAATTTQEYFTLDGFVQDQVTAVSAYKPTRDLLLQLSALVTAEHKLLVQVTGTPQPAQLLCADGVGSAPQDYWTTYYGLMSYPLASPGSRPLEAQWLADDQTSFHAAASSQDYVVLNQRLAGQIAQIQATNATLVPSVAANFLAGFKADIQTLTNYDTNIPAIKTAFSRIHSLSTFPSLNITGWSVTAPAMQNLSSHIASYQKQYDQDAQLLASESYGNYTKAVQQIQKHRNGLQFDLAYAKTYLDIKTFVDLIAQGQAHTTLNNQPTGDNKNYPDAYEYIYQGTGIGDVINPTVTKIFGQGRLYNASTIDDYHYLDTELQMFITNITAMLTNLSDKTPYNQAHQTDLTLMQHYGIMQGKVLVVSLREQTARLYQDGKLVKAVYVTTGAPNLPSAPGMNCTSGAQLNQLMVSPDPPGSPDYYQPTPVKFAIYYHNYGLEIHDAWWRDKFGPLTNLPHYDPAAFNGGSHGCINMSKYDMPWVFNWINYQNIPAVVY